MLRITASKNADGAMKYFSEGLSKEDYYTNDKEITGTWHGTLKDKLQLSENVDKEIFKKIIHNRTPSGDKLTPRDKKNRRPGYDFTFNAPKSVSLVYAITNDDDILDAHRDAVLEAMSEVEINMQTQSGQGKLKHYKTTGNMLMAKFDHFTARPVQSEPGKIAYPDPHMHSHCFVLNTTWHTEKNRYQAIELGTVKKEAPYYEAIYHAAMIRNLEKSGYQIQTNKRFWEIKGVERSTIDKYSKRTQEIQKTILEKNLKWAVDKSKIGAKTRLKKNKLMSTSELIKEWNSRLSESEKKSIYSLKNKHHKSEDGDKTTIQSPQKAIDRAIEHYFERKSVVSEKRVLGYAISQNFGKVSIQQIRSAWAKRQDIISAEKNGSRLITTKEMMNQEKTLLEFATKTRNKLPPLHNTYKIKREFLNNQQKKAVEHILTSKDQVTILAGGAGTGKTSLLQEVRTAHEEKNKTLFAFAPSADASRGVLRDKGFKNANTIAHLLNDEREHEKLNKQTILIDEAGMVSLRDMNKIFSIAKSQQARVILSGDWRQHHAVQAGDALRLLDERAKIPVARVNEIVRQRDNPKYKNAIKALADGNTVKGFKMLDKMGAIKEVTDVSQRHEKIVAEYLKSKEAKRSAIIVSPTHAEGKSISKSIRSQLREKGYIGKEDHYFTTLRASHLTEAEKQDHRQYSKGQVLQFHQNVIGIKAGRKYEIDSIKDDGEIFIKTEGSNDLVSLPLTEHKRFQIYNKETIGITKGDTLRITRNGYTVDKTRLNNGQILKVEGINDEGHIRLSNGQALSKDFHNFSLGYYRTSHSSQGKDAQDVFLVQSAQSFTASNDKQFYVSASRGEQRCFIFTDDKKGLLDAVQRTSDRLSAQELIDQQSFEKKIQLQYNKIKQHIHGKQKGRKSEYSSPKKQVAKSEGPSPKHK